MEDKTFKLLEILYNEFTGFKSEFTSFKSEFADLKGEVTGLKGEFTSFKSEFADLKGEVTGLKGEFTSFKSEFADLKGEVTSFKSEFTDFRKETNERLDSIDKRLTFIEQDHGKKLQVLFDGHKQHSDQLDRIEARLSSHDDILVRKIK